MLDAKKMIRELAEIPTFEERMDYWKVKAQESRLGRQGIKFIISCFEDQADDMNRFYAAILGYRRCCTVNTLYAQHKLITALFAVYFPKEAVELFINTMKSK